MPTLQTAIDSKISRGRKFDQVIEGAREVFMSEGFEGASVDTIARVAGVSKATLYSYFPDKRLLFIEVVRQECLRQADEALNDWEGSASVVQTLHDVATRIVAFYCSDFGQGVYRICVAESARFPEIGRLFYESGAKLARERLAQYLHMACGHGKLEIDDCDLAADQFVKLCEADLLDRLVCRVADHVSETQRQRVIDGAVRVFMASYGAPRP